MFRVQRLGGLQQSSLMAIRFRFPCAIEKPVGQKLKLDVFHAVVIKNRFHFFQCSLMEDVFQISMPDSNALEAGPGRGFYSIFEIEAANFAHTWEHPCGCPE